MNDFLQQVWLDNTVKRYLVVAGIILFVIILNRVISHYFAGLLFRIVNRIWKNVEKKSFTSLIVQPLGTFLVILVSIIALYKLKFPSVLQVEIYQYTVKQIIHATGIAILIFAFTWFLLRIIDFTAIMLEKKANLTPEQTDNQLVAFLRTFSK